MDILVLVVFVLVYAGMVPGEVPGLALDGCGIALSVDGKRQTADVV